MAQLVPSQPVQGVLYHHLQTLIATNYSGLGPQNVSSSKYAPMVGQSFQKPLSGATHSLTPVVGNAYR